MNDFLYFTFFGFGFGSCDKKTLNMIIFFVSMLDFITDMIEQYNNFMLILNIILKEKQNSMEKMEYLVFEKNIRNL